jgi:hypothetical protein
MIVPLAQSGKLATEKLSLTGEAKFVTATGSPAAGVFLVLDRSSGGAQTRGAAVQVEHDE